jgi:hypothetical protein
VNRFGNLIVLNFDLTPKACDSLAELIVRNRDQPRGLRRSKNRNQGRVNLNANQSRKR